MKIALAQLNPTIGDLTGNVRLCRDAAQKAANLGADLVVLPEMVIPGYPPRDMLWDASFVEATLAATRDLAVQCRDLPPLLFGSIAPTGGRGLPNLFNAAYLARDGDLTIAAKKRLLPAYDVFHEPRWFAPGTFTPLIKVAGQKIGVLICEDLWDDTYPIHPAAELKAAGAEILVCLSASPYRQGILEQRLTHARRAAGNMPLVFVNAVGANDELIFDGRSFALCAGGMETLPGFVEEVWAMDLDEICGVPKFYFDTAKVELRHSKEDLAAALTLGIRDFARKNGMKRVFIGLSGGIDSALVAVLAVRALGAENVTGVAIPSRFTNPQSTSSARELCQKLGCGFEVVELEPLHRAAESTLGALLEAGNGAENAQARLRMVILMSFVNRYGGFLLNTSNKTELSLGYATLYGDMAGALCPIADLTKPEVYALAGQIGGEIIPPFILERSPSAELKPGQVDPFDYDKISPQMEALVRENQSNPALKRSEHKRWQFGIVLKVSEKAFGSGRMMPVTKL